MRNPFKSTIWKYCQTLNEIQNVGLPILSDKENEYLFLVSCMEVEDVEHFVQQNPGLNVNCVDFQGISALHLAIRNNDEEMVKYLLSLPFIDVGDAAFHAIKEDHPQILNVILNKLSATCECLEFCGCTHSAFFSTDMTPLMLAAHYGNYHIIQLLMKRGHSIKDPHHPKCCCESFCSRSNKMGDILFKGTSRLNIYRALSNPAYLCQTTNDPLLKSFELSAELEEIAAMSPEFGVQYLELAKEVRLFAVKLLGYCRSSKDIELILRNKKGNPYGSCYDYPLLHLAIHYRQKEFLAHPYIQQVLETAWVGSWTSWKSKYVFEKVLNIFLRIPLLPFVVIVVLLFPRHPYYSLLNYPVNKMINEFASYVVFLIILFLESNQNKKLHQRRGPPNFGFEIFIVIYVMAFIRNYIRLLLYNGPRAFFRYFSHWYDGITYSLFVMTFLFWLLAYLDIKENDERELKRTFWYEYDPTLLAEGTLAIATIFAYGRILFMCQLNYSWGRIQCLMGKISSSLKNYLPIFLVILVSFTVGLCRLYHYYQGMVEHVNGRIIYQPDSFVSFPDTMRTLFSAWFGMERLSSTKVVIESIHHSQNKTKIIFQNFHNYTEYIGYLSFVAFEVISFIILINIIILILSRILSENTQCTIDSDWALGKTEFYLNYLVSPVLPPPFNLLPTPYTCVAGIEWILLQLRPIPGRKSQCSLMHCCYIEDALLADEIENVYPVLIAQLTQRYFMQKEMENYEPVTASDIVMVHDELKNTKSSMKEIKEMIMGMKEIIKECKSSSKDTLGESSSTIFNDQNKENFQCKPNTISNY